MADISIDDLFQMNMERFITCCFTGHRPQKLSFRFDESAEACVALKKKLRSAAVEAIGRGYKTFISGGGLGFDLYAAAAILDLKREYPYIRLHLALPCMDYQRKWQPEQKKTLETIISQADKTVYVSEQAYFEGCMQLRNKYMVDHANLLIAAYNGSSGGTKNTIAYAEKSFIDIMLLSLEKVEE